MILRVLLLITFTCCVSGTFVVNVTQSFYQAEENHNITLEWSFTTEAETSHKDIFVYCHMIRDHKASTMFHLREGLEDPESQDDQFSGRVQCDKDVLREGRLRLHVSRLKTEDSGNYLCEVSTSYGGGYAKCGLSVTAARDQPEPERPNTASRGRIALYWSLGVMTAAVLCLLVCLRFFLQHLPKKIKLCIHCLPDEKESNHRSERSSSSAEDQRCLNLISQHEHRKSSSLIGCQLIKLKDTSNLPAVSGHEIESKFTTEIMMFFIFMLTLILKGFIIRLRNLCR